MLYEPIKEKIHSYIIKNRLYRKVFYRLLDIFILRQWYVKKAIKKYLLKNKELLFYDAGAGFCQYSDFVLSNYKKVKVYALDLLINVEREAKYFVNKKERINFTQANLETHKLSSPKADFVIAIDILEHIQDDMAVLNNFYQSMNINAYLLISTPSNHDLAALFTEEHVRPGYSLSELIHKVEKQGFAVIEHNYSYGFWGKLYWKLIMKNGSIIFNTSKFLRILLPLYLVIVFIPSLIFMWLDIIHKNKIGNGIIIVAKKIVDKNRL